MNSISWLLYLADVAQSIGVAAGLACLCAGLAIAFAGLCYVAADGDIGVRSYVKTGIIVFAVAGSIGIVTPSKNTVYAIAASELGQRVVTSEVGTDLSKEAIATLKDWLRKQRADDSKTK